MFYKPYGPKLSFIVLSERVGFPTVYCPRRTTTTCNVITQGQLLACLLTSDHYICVSCFCFFFLIDQFRISLALLLYAFFIFPKCCNGYVSVGIGQHSQILQIFRESFSSFSFHVTMVSVQPVRRDHSFFSQVRGCIIANTLHHSFNSCT